MANVTDNALVGTNGGQHYGNIAQGGATGNVSVYTLGGGRLCRVILTSAGNATASFSIYDNALGNASGNLIWKSPPGNSTYGYIGASYDVQIPFALGLAVAQTDGSPAATLTYNGNGVNGA